MGKCIGGIAHDEIIAYRYGATLTNLEELLLKLFTRETVWKGNKLREASSKGYMKEI